MTCIGQVPSKLLKTQIQEFQKGLSIIGQVNMKCIWSRNGFRVKNATVFKLTQNNE